MGWIDTLFQVEEGATRKVFIFKNIVIKVPSLKEYRLFLNGILANLQEKVFSGSHPDLARVKFCDGFGLLLIMEKAKVISNDVNWLEFSNILINKYEDDEMKEFLLSDPKPNNWGYVGNHLVKIDYGN